ncbi:MAG: hypothetical protein WD995_05040 [Gemmatimonadota bacterium]
MLRAIILSIVLSSALLAAGCQSRGNPSGDPRLQIGEDLALEGSVTAIDATAMFVDGDGLLIVDSPEYGVITLRIPARESQCPARGLATFHVLEVGDVIRAVGTVSAESVVTVCRSESHLLERAP